MPPGFFVCRAMTWQASSASILLGARSFAGICVHPHIKARHENEPAKISMSDFLQRIQWLANGCPQLVHVTDGLPGTTLCQAVFLKIFLRWKRILGRAENVLNQNTLSSFDPVGTEIQIVTMTRFVKKPLAAPLPFPQRFL